MTRSRLRRVVLPIAILLALQAAAVAIYLSVQRSRSAPEADRFEVERLHNGARAPNILLERADGSTTYLHELDRSARLVHFWATWCPPCVEELPGLMETSRALAGRGLTLVAISMDHDWSKIRAFFGGRVPAEIFRAVDPEAHEAFDIVALPDTYLVAPDHELRFRYGGARAWRAPSAWDHLESVLGE